MKFEPHPYQRYCINRVIADSALGLFLDMGLGKTVITLTAVNDLRYNRFAINRALVIAPKKVAEDTWMREQAKWDHLAMLRVVPILGSRQKRIRAINTPGDVYVVSRDNVQWLVDYYRNDWPYDMVIIDELSSFKNPKAKRFKSLKLIRNHIKRMVGLTGTPTSNGLTDLWAQIYLLDQGERLGRTLTSYRQKWFTPGKRNQNAIFSYEPVQGAEEEIKEQIKDICVSMSAEDYLSLPERIDNVIHVKLDPKAEKLYREFERDMLISVNENEIDATTAAVLGNKLLQLCNGAVYDGDKQVVEIHDNKLDAFMELVEASQGKPMLVFYTFQHDKQRIMGRLKKSHLRVSGLKDPGVIEQWNRREIDVLLAHPASAAYGLNLQQGGSTIVWFGLNWSLELYQQANARLYRQGQQERVIIHHLVTDGHQDERVLEALNNKNVTQKALLDMLKARIEEIKAGK